MQSARWILPTLALPLWLAAPDEQLEPAPRFELRLGETTLEIAAGTPFEVEIAGQVLRGELVSRPTRRLALDGLAFEYPEGMTFEYERFLDTEIWTLDGNDSTVLVYRYGTPVDLQEVTDFIASGLAESFGEANAGSAALALGAREVPGSTMTHEGGSFVIRSEVYVLDADKDGAGRHVLVLQDLRDDADEATAEFVRVRALIATTYASDEPR